MISYKKLKISFLAAIITILIHLLLFGLLNLEFLKEQSSLLSNSDLDNILLQLEDISPEDVSMTPPGKDPLTNQKDKSSESVSKEKGVLKTQQAEPQRTSTDQEAQVLATPDTIIVPKPELVLLPKNDSVIQAEKDSVISAQITQLQKISKRKDANSERYQKEREKYQYYQKNYRNIRNFKKVYPYALKTKEIIDSLNAKLSTLTNEFERKKLIKETEKTLFKEYEIAVRTMSTSQGRLLLKLISRETNKTGFQIIKDYKGAFPATFWYSVGKIFGTDLKTEFHKENEDSVIENILSKYQNNDLY